MKRGPPPVGAPVILGGAAAGLAVGSLHSAAAAAAVLAGAAAAAWAARLGSLQAVALVAAVAIGIGAGGWRDSRLEAGGPVPAFLAPGSRAELQEAPRAERFGWRALAKVGAGRLLLRGAGRPPRFTAGDLAAVNGRVRALRPEEAWLRVRRVSGVASVQAVMPVGRRGGLSGFVDAIRRRADASLSRGLGPDAASLMRGMVLGDDSAMSPSLRQAMRSVGLGHVVAASGANVAILLALVLGACAVVGAGFRTRIAVGACAVALYAPLCGGGPSIVRAAVGGIAVLAATLVSRPASRWQALLLAAVVTLAIDPQSWRDVAWQLSYAAVLGIGLLAGPARSWLGGRGVPPLLAEPAAVTFAATTATAPVSAAAFGTLSPVSLPVNVIAAPLVAPATWLGMAAGAVGQAGAGLGAPFVALARWPLAGLLVIVQGASRIPFAQVHAGPVAAGVLSLAAVAALASNGARRGQAWLRALAVAALLAIPAWLLLGPEHGPGPPPDRVPRISFLDVGQGDATLFQSRGRSLLVDTGSPGAGVTARLREAGVDRLDMLLVTHAQADHLGGAAEVLRSLPVGMLVDGRSGVSEPAGRAMAAEATARGVRVVRPQAGDRFPVGAFSVEVLWPPGTPGAVGDPNLRCVVLRVSTPGWRMLLGADAESEVLRPLHPGPVDLLKVSHHGSADPGLGLLLRELRPSLAVIEVGAGNSYGHPAPETLGTLAGAGTRVMRTDRDGTVRVDLAAGSMRVQGRP